MDFVIGGLAAQGATIFSNPIDVMKTRMQLQGELKGKGHHAVFYKNTFHAGYVIAKNEGIRGLQKGLGAALIMHSVRNSVRLGLYQWLTKHGYVTNHHGNTVFYKSVLASSLSGAAGAFFGSPLFLIKTQLQSQANEKIAVGHQHGHSGVFEAFRKIYTQFGIMGLWRGVNGTMLRAITGSSSQLTTFAITKDYLRTKKQLDNSPILKSIIASIIGGAAQTICMQPFDLVSTRLFNQGTDSQGKGLLYDGIRDCFMKIYKTEGFRGLYKGVGANYMRLAPHSALCLVFWDFLKSLQAKYVNG